MSYIPDYFLWIDLETSSLDPNNGCILEIAGILTDSNRKFNEIYSFNKVFKPIKTYDWHPKVLEMHIKNGLLKEVFELEHVYQIETYDDEIIDILNDYIDEPFPKIVMAGSSVHFDKQWLSIHAKRLNSMLSYRLFDVSVIKTCYEMLGASRIDDEIRRHRAMDDIKWSLKQARIILEKGFKEK